MDGVKDEIWHDVLSELREQGTGVARDKQKIGLLQ